MATDGDVTWSVVKRRRLRYFVVAMVALAAGLAVMSIAPRFVDDLPRVLILVLPLLCLGPFLVLSLMSVRTRTVAGRHAVHTGEVLPDTRRDDLREELRVARTLNTQALVSAAAVVVLMPAGAIGAHVNGTAVVGLVSWTTALLVIGVVLGAVWGWWQLRRRRRLNHALETIGEA